MTARPWLLGLMGGLTTLLAPASPSWADQRAVTVLVPGLPALGSQLDEARAIPLPEGWRLVCDGDTDAPPLSDPNLLKSPSSGETGRIRLCAILAAGVGSEWGPAIMPGVGGLTRAWMLFVEQGGGGRLRLARISLWADRSGWDRVAATLTETLGPPTVSGDRLLGWEDGQHETLMVMEPRNPGEFAVAVSDVRLRRLLKRPGTPSRAN